MQLGLHAASSLLLGKRRWWWPACRRWTSLCWGREEGLSSQGEGHGLCPCLRSLWWRASLFLFCVFLPFSAAAIDCSLRVNRLAALLCAAVASCDSTSGVPFRPAEEWIRQTSCLSRNVKVFPLLPCILCSTSRDIFFHPPHSCPPLMWGTHMACRRAQL